MKKVMTIFGAIMITLFMLTSCGAPDASSIATKTFKSGYYYLFFKVDHSIEIYQKSSRSSFARGCAADGKWSIENGKVKVKVTQSYCGTESYIKFNGLYELRGNCIKNERFSFCND